MYRHKSTLMLSAIVLSLFLVHVNSLGEFVARCTIASRAQDDPLVYPRQPGASHMHDFFGAVGVNAHSTVLSIRQSPQTTCNPPVDHSSYWIPTLISNGQYVAPERATLYYHAFNHHSQVQPMPLGLSMIARKWSFNCFQAGETTNSEDPSLPRCGAGGKLEMYINYPQCWNGRDLNSTNFMSHMAYQVGGNCPQGFPVLLPRLQFKFVFPTRGGPGTRLSSGPGNTAHSDFVNGWDPAAMNIRVNQCLRQNRKCPERMTGDPQAAPYVTIPPSAIQHDNIPTMNDDHSADNTNPATPIPTVPLDSVEVLSVGDAFVRGGEESDTNFGDNTDLIVKKSNDPLYTREAFIKFNLDGNGIRGDIVSATLQLTVNPELASPEAFYVQLGYVIDDAWEEMDITYNTRPDSAPIATLHREANQMVVTHDVTAQVQDSWANNRVPSFQLYSDETTDLIYFASREAGAGVSPKLIITYSPTPAQVGEDSAAASHSVVFAMVVCMLVFLSIFA